MRIRSVETAIRADVSRNIPNGVDALGIFDNFSISSRKSFYNTFFLRNGRTYNVPSENKCTK